MSLIDYTQLEDGQDASANGLNERFGKIIDTVNGNIDVQNLKNGAVTREKIAPKSITSDKLGFEKYIDDNGWMVIDLGMVKLASKTRSFKTKNIGVGGTAFVDFDANMSNLPVGFNNNMQYQMMWSFWGTGNVGKFKFEVESQKPTPDSAVVMVQTSGAGEVRTCYMNVWVMY